MKYLEEGDILYKLVYYPEIYLDIYYVNSIVNYRKYDNTMLILTTAIIGEHSFTSWIECTVNIDKLISMPLYSITSDKAKEMEEKYKAKTEELDNFIKNETPVTLWRKDIDELEKELKKEGMSN